MMRIVVGVIAVVMALGAGGIFFIARYLQTPEFKETVLSTLQEAAGTEVEVARMDISVLSGIALEGVRVADPSNPSDEFFTADRLVMRHQLLPLLRRQVQIDRLSLDRPVVTVVQREDGAWNFEQFLSSVEESGGEPVAPAGEALQGEDAFNVTLSQFSLGDGEISMMDSEGGVITQVHDLHLSSSISFQQGRLNGVGNLSAERLNFGNALLVTNLKAPILVSPEAFKISPVVGSLAGGEFSGDIVLNTAPEFQYQMDIQLRGADVNALLLQAGINLEIQGQLQASAQVEGHGGLPTMVGQGQASVAGGRVSQLPAQELVASLLQTPSLGEIEFEECVVEFTLADNVLETSVIRLLSPLVEVTGQGSVSLEQKTLDHDMMLALSQEMLSQLPAPLLQAFSQREDGFYTLEFHLWGPYDAPQTDLQKKIAQGAVEGLLEKGLEGLKNLFR